LGEVLFTALFSKGFFAWLAIIGGNNLPAFGALEAFVRN
jgi:hypothetical protein